jgi:hypothetical protein
MGGTGSGGARRHSGPPLDFQALRRNKDYNTFTKLPAAGRLAPAPEWPIAVQEPSNDELLKWRELWTIPQALIWEQDRAYDLVAFYVRTYLEAMKPKAGAQARMFVRQLSNDLYLAPAALASGKYVIENSPEADALDAAERSAKEYADRPKGRAGRPPGSRNKFKIVKPDITESSAEDDEEDGDKPDDLEIPF